MLLAPFTAIWIVIQASCSTGRRDTLDCYWSHNETPSDLIENSRVIDELLSADQA